MRGAKTFCFWLVAVLLAPAGSTLSREVTTLVSAFGGDELGRSIGTIVYLDLWRRVAIPLQTDENPRNVVTTKVQWSRETLSDYSYQSGEEVARKNGYQLVLWGTLTRLGDVIVAQPLLVIVPDENGERSDELTWVIQNGEGPSSDIRATIPRLQYDLPPIILGNEPLDAYRDPSSVNVYRGTDKEPPRLGELGEPIGTLDGSYKVLRNEGEFTQVVDRQNRKGWIYVPKLKGDESINFAAGVINLFRRDYSNAIRLFRMIPAPSPANPGLGVDSLLLQALATAKLGDDPSSLIEAAEKSNPYLKETKMFRIADLAYLSQSASPSTRLAARSDLEHVLNESRYMFEIGDTWFDACSRFLASQETEPAGQIEIGLVTATEVSPYFVKIRQAATAEAEKQGAKLIVRSGRFDGDEEGQVTALEDLIGSGVKGILIATNDSIGMAGAIKKARDKGILVIALNKAPNPPDAVDATLATDNFAAGVLQGEYARKALGDKRPRLAMLDGTPSDLIDAQRHNGFLKGFGIQETDSALVGKLNTYGTQEGGQVAMEQLLTAHPDINAVYTVNEPVAEGASRAITVLGKLRDIVVTSFDGSRLGLEYVQQGKIAATVMQSPKIMANKGVDYIVDYARTGKKPSGIINTGATLITNKSFPGLESKDVEWALQNSWG